MRFNTTGVEFVRGGSDGARLVPYEGEEMARGRALTEKERQTVYTMHCLGEKKADIASAYGISESTVHRIISEQRKKKEERNEMAGGQQIVAGDKAHGRLMSCADRNRFEGTCIVGGKSKKRTFTAVNAKNAKQQWEKWCQTLRDEQEFMDMVERNVETREEPREQEPVEEKVDVTPAPAPEISVRPWKDVAEERQKRIEELEAELEEAKTQRVEFAEGYQMEQHNPAYLIWTKQPEPRCYGLYLTMEDALAEVDRLNDVAKFLGQGGAFKVEEVAWK